MTCHNPPKLLIAELEGVEGGTAGRAGQYLLSDYIMSESSLILQTSNYNFTNIISFNAHSIAWK